MSREAVPIPVGAAVLGCSQGQWECGRGAAKSVVGGRGSLTERASSSRASHTGYAFVSQHACRARPTHMDFRPSSCGHPQLSPEHTGIQESSAEAQGRGRAQQEPREDPHCPHHTTQQHQLLLGPSLPLPLLLALTPKARRDFWQISGPQYNMCHKAWC